MRIPQLNLNLCEAAKDILMKMMWDLDYPVRRIQRHLERLYLDHVL